MEKALDNVVVPMSALVNLARADNSTSSLAYLQLLKLCQFSNEPYIEVDMEWLKKQCNTYLEKLYFALNILEEINLIHHFKVWKDGAEYVRVYSMLGWDSRR